MAAITASHKKTRQNELLRFFCYPCNELEELEDPEDEFDVDPLCASCLPIDGAVLPEELLPLDEDDMPLFSTRVIVASVDEPSLVTVTFTLSPALLLDRNVVISL